jgi:hypothetical protein
MINSIIKRIEIEKCRRRASVLLKFHRHGCSFRERWGEVHFQSVVRQTLSADPESVLKIRATCLFICEDRMRAKIFKIY